MHRQVILAISMVLFGLLAAAAMIVDDLHDRGYPVQLGAKSAVDLDFSESGMSDAEAFRQLGILSDRLELGLVKVAPDLGGDQSGQVFVMVGVQNSFPHSIQRFGDQPDAEVRENASLEHSYARGQYLITGETTRLAEFNAWLTDHGVSSSWHDDTLGDRLLLLMRQSSFATSLVAAAALMVSLVLYWLSVKARGRALRVLAGVSTWRIQYEDLGGFLAVMSAAAVVCNAVAVVYVGLTHGWVFVPHYARELLTFDTIVIVATMVCAVAMSVVSWPSAAMLSRPANQRLGACGRPRSPSRPQPSPWSSSRSPPRSRHTRMRRRSPPSRPDGKFCRITWRFHLTREWAKPVFRISHPAWATS